MFNKKNKIKQEIQNIKNVKSVLFNHLEEWKKRGEEIDIDIFDATKHIMEENIDALDSMIILCEKNHFRNSLMLTRYILENSANLLYIHKENSKTRAYNYLAFSLELLIRRYENCNDPSIQNTEIYKKMKIAASKRMPTGKNKDYWDGLTIKEVFCKVELTEIYDTFYRRLSNYVHSQYGPKIDLTNERPFHEFLYKWLFYDILVIILEGLKVINENYNLMEGGVIFHNYPKEKCIFLFSLNNDAMDKYQKDVK